VYFGDRGSQTFKGYGLFDLSINRVGGARS
jgi:hypothetical protein